MSWFSFLFTKISISSALFFGRRYISNINNPLFESEILLAEILQFDRLYLKKNPRNFLGFFKKMQFLFFLLLRKKNTPVAYIFGYKYWRNQKIYLNPSVLIPRDETEILCEHIFTKNKNPKKILDIGTGSGCISIVCAKQYPKAFIEGIDISQKALLVAQKNKNFTGMKNIKFFQSDMLQKIPEKSHYNIIIANLPYVPTQEPISQEVRKEPLSAIFSGKNGLVHIKKLKTQLQEKNISFDQLWLEFLPYQYGNIQNIFSKYTVSPFKDIEGKIFFACIKEHLKNASSKKISDF